MIHLSVIIPVFNSAKYLSRCLESVFMQDISEEDFEVIIINDGSTDKSVEIIQEFSSRHPNMRVYNQANCGQSIARNRGIQLAKGKYLHFVDSDDYIHPCIYKNLLDILERIPAQMLIFDLKEVYDESQVIHEVSFEDVQEMSGYEYARDYSLMPFGPWQYIINKEFIISHDISFPEGVYFEDIVFGAKALLDSDTVLKLDQQLYYYVQYNATSTTKNKDRNHLLKIAHDAVIASANFSDILSAKGYKDEIRSIVWLKNHFSLWGIVNSLWTGSDYNEIKARISFLKKNKCYPIKIMCFKPFWIKCLAVFANMPFVLYLFACFCKRQSNNTVKVDL